MTGISCQHTHSVEIINPYEVNQKFRCFSIPSVPHEKETKGRIKILRVWVRTASRKPSIEGFHVTPYQANFVSHHARNRQVGFLFTLDDFGKYNKMLHHVLFYFIPHTKLQLSDKNISTHTHPPPPPTRLKFQILSRINPKLQAVFFFCFCFCFFFLLFSTPRCTKRKQRYVANIVLVLVRTVSCKPFIACEA